MSRFKILFNRYFYIIFFLFLFIFSINLNGYNSNFHQSKYYEYASNFSHKYFSFRSSIIDYFNLKNINKQLEAENKYLKENTIENYSIKNRNTIIINNKEYTRKSNLLNCRIIKNSTNRNDNYLIIDIGKKNKVKKEFGVISNKSIIGFTIYVEKDYSVVMSMNNTKFNIQAKIKDKNYVGTLSKSSNDKINYFTLSDINTYCEIKLGDTILTQGEDGIFPPDIPIGKIVRIDENPSNSTYHIKIKSFEDFYSLNKVYVLNTTNKNQLDSLDHFIELLYKEER